MVKASLLRCQLMAAFKMLCVGADVGFWHDPDDYWSAPVGVDRVKLRF